MHRILQYGAVSVFSVGTLCAQITVGNGGAATVGGTTTVNGCGSTSPCTLANGSTTTTQVQSDGTSNLATDLYVDTGLVLKLNANGITTSTTGGGSINVPGTGTFGTVAAGTIVPTNPLDIGHGGTGATTAAGANLNITGVTQTGTLGTSSQVSAFPGTVSAGTAVLTPVLHRYSSYTAWGDSITAGCCVSTANMTNLTNLSYVGLLGSFLGLTPVNNGVGGQTSYERNTAIYSTVTPSEGSPLSTYMIGTNDQNYLNPITGDRIQVPAQFGLSVTAGAVWLALPDAQKIKGSQMLAGTNGGSCTGTWATSTMQSYTFGIVSTTTGSACTASVFGDAIYVGYTIVGSSTNTAITPSNYAGTFSVKVDGVTIPASAYAANITYNSNGDWTTLAQCMTDGCALDQNWQTYGPHVIRIPVAAPASMTTDVSSAAPSQFNVPTTHTVVVAVTSPTGANDAVYLDWVGANGNGTANPTNGPTVLLGETPRAPIQGQDAGHPSNEPAEGTTGTFAWAIDTICQQLSADGLNVACASTRAAFGNNLTLNSNMTNSVHPNQAGHALLAQAFEQPLNQLRDNETFQGAQYGANRIPRLSEVASPVAPTSWQMGQNPLAMNWTSLFNGLSVGSITYPGNQDSSGNLLRFVGGNGGTQQTTWTYIGAPPTASGGIGFDVNGFEFSSWNGTSYASYLFAGSANNNLCMGYTAAECNNGGIGSAGGFFGKSIQFVPSPGGFTSVMSAPYLGGWRTLIVPDASGTVGVIPTASTGHATCETTTHTLGHCTSVVASDGTCTCG